MTKLIQRLGIASLALALGLLLLTGIGCIGAASGGCEPGETCECDGIGSCDSTCEGGDCNFVCEGVGNCSFDCPDGGCHAFCHGSGHCDLACPGGDCLLVCGGAGHCEISECQAGGCEIR